jgi:hypothetical protein
MFFLIVIRLALLWETPRATRFTAMADCRFPLRHHRFLLRFNSQAVALSAPYRLSTLASSLCAR